MATPSREVAYDILLRVEQQDAYASELLHGGRLESLSPDDRNLATEIVMGTLRWRARLDFGIAAVSKEPLHKLDKEVLIALRVGAYQIGWLRLPARAAVNESVELVKRARFRYSAPYVNAVPKSGCFITSAMGSATRAPNFNMSRKSSRSFFNSLRYRAVSNIITSLANSDT